MLYQAIQSSVFSRTAAGIFLVLCFMFTSTESLSSGINASPDSPRTSSFACLPNDVRLDEVLVAGRDGKRNITVQDRLLAMKARCRNGKLVDNRRREIRFFRLTCWGNPPPDYLEVQNREKEELAKLKRRYQVIVFTCNPMIQ